MKKTKETYSSELEALNANWLSRRELQALLNKVLKHFNFKIHRIATSAGKMHCLVTNPGAFTVYPSNSYNTFAHHDVDIMLRDSLDFLVVFNVVKEFNYCPDSDIYADYVVVKNPFYGVKSLEEMIVMLDLISNSKMHSHG